jgi:plasmid stabilization system protein ParE
MLPIRVRPDAVSDIESAFRWYHDQREELANDFRNHVHETLNRVRKSPELYPRVHDKVRRAAVHRFPYGVFYTVEDNTIVVHPVLHDRRDPRLWQWRAGE